MAENLKNKDIALVVFETLKDDILHLKIKPGEALLEADVCERFNASRTPVRTAFQRLSDSGLIQIIPYKGARASLIDLSIVHQSIFMRSAIEEKVLKQYINLYDEYSICDVENNLRKQQILLDSNSFTPAQFYHIDGELHKIWFYRMGNDYLWNLIQNLDVHYTRFKILDLVDDASHFQEIFNEHKLLVEAIVAKDLVKVSEVIDDHLQGGVRRLSERITSDFASFFTERKN